MKSYFYFTIAILSVASAAAADPVTNGSFELGNYTTNNQAAGSTDITGWTIAAGAVEWATGAASTPYGSLEASDGQRFIDLTGLSDNSLNRLTQTIATTPGSVYSLSFDLGWTNTLSSSAVRVSAGNTTAVYDPMLLGLGNGQIAWHTQSLVFTALTTTTEIAFENTIIAQFGGLDNVRAQAVPEPLPVFAMALGVSGLLARRRSCRQ